MPNLPISQLPVASTLTGPELFAVVQNEVTKQTTLSSIFTFSSNNYGLFNQTSSSTPVTNTTTETSLLNSGVGTLSVPANNFKVGDGYRLSMVGHISSKNNDTLQIRVKTGAVLLADTDLITMPTATNKHWNLDIDFTIRAIGVAGVAVIASGGKFFYTKNASNAFEGANFSIINSTTFDTTINNTLSITAQWGAADVLNSIYSEIVILTKTY